MVELESERNVKQTIQYFSMSSENENEAIALFQASITRSLGISTNEWSYCMETRRTSLRGEELKINYFEFSGLGSLESSSPIAVVLSYSVNRSGKQKGTEWTCDNIYEAIKSLFNFTKDYKVCQECGTLMKIEDTCEPCIMFTCYQKYHGKETMCAICQETVHRTVLMCGHSFHYTCITKLDPNAARCPMCRNEFTRCEVEEFFLTEYDDDDVDDEDDENNDDNGTDEIS